MSVLKMQRISICALKKDRKAILEKLQSLGVLEVDIAVGGDAVGGDSVGGDGVGGDGYFRKMDTAGQKAGFERAAAAADQALDVLERYVPEKKSVFAALEGKLLIGRGQALEIEENRREILRTAKKICGLDREHAEKLAEAVRIRNSIEGLAPWMSLDVPLKDSATKRTVLFPGTMPGGTTLDSICEVIAEKAPDAAGADIRIISSEQSMVYLAVVCLKEDAAAVEDALRSAGFARPAQTWEKTPAEEREELEQQEKTCAAETAEIEEQIRELSEHRTEIKIAADYYRVRADKYEVLGELPQSERTFVISGYIPQCEAGHVESWLSERYDCAVDIEDLKEDEEPPVILKNNPFSMNMEGVVESYGLPHKGEFDPTTIMSFFYVFFFGMMLSDAAYGAIVAIVCFIALKKFPRMSAGMHKSLKLFMFCGISTIVWGVLFGGYFGDVVDVVSSVFFGKEVSVPPLWFAPLNDPMKLLVFSMLFGVIHLFVGLGIKGYMELKDGKILDFFCDVVLWYVFLMGLILMLLPSEIFRSISQMEISFPPFMNTLAKALAIVGAVGLLLMSGRDNKNPVLRLALGAYDIYNITGWLSDVLSYSRLLALGLATGVIASVVNQMGSMMGKSVFGVLLFIVVFIVGHAMNLAINLLGAYVHTNRLQFVEFFGKFYEGGGKPFEPFESDTKYVDIKEETLS